MKTGSLYERAQRIKNVIKFIYEKLGKNDDQFENYLIYANTDLATDLVKNFLLLQGKGWWFLANFENFPKMFLKLSQINTNMSSQSHTIIF